MTLEQVIIEAQGRQPVIGRDNLEYLVAHLSPWAGSGDEPHWTQQFTGAVWRYVNGVRWLRMYGERHPCPIHCAADLDRARVSWRRCRPGWVYAIAFGDRVKVGLTRSPERRFAELRRLYGDGDILSLVEHECGERGEALEQVGRLQHWLGGEWYRREVA
jgi:hypothetical protein